MVLQMVRPYAHPKTGVYWIRKRVPAALRTSIGRGELKASLQTKNPQEAKLKAPAAIAKFDLLLSSARGEAPRLTQREVEVIAGEWYRDMKSDIGDNPGSPGEWEISRLIMDRQIDWPDRHNGDPEADVSLTLTARNRAEASGMLVERGRVPDLGTIERLGKAILKARWALTFEMERRANGDWRPDDTAERFPAMRPATNSVQSAPHVEISMLKLFEGWAGEAQPAPRRRYDREQTIKVFIRFVGHDDANRVIAEDVVRWKEFRLRTVKPATVARDIRMISPIWKWAKANRKLVFVDNPFAGVAPTEKNVAGPPARSSFTKEQAADLLQAARKESGAARWLPWLAAMTGARLGEMCQSDASDILRTGEDGQWFIDIHARSVGRTLKTVHSARQVPLHPALISEGFLQYVQALPEGSPLFPDVPPDKFGKRVGNATKTHGRWVRGVLKSKDRGVDPAHGWRHWFRDACIRAGVPQPVIDAALGHKNTQNEGEGYGRGYRFMPDVTAAQLSRIVPPLL